MALISEFPDGVPSADDWLLVERAADLAYVRVSVGLLGVGGTGEAKPWRLLGGTSYAAVTGDRLVLSTGISVSLPNPANFGDEIYLIGAPEIKLKLPLLTDLNLYEQKAVTALKLAVPLRIVALTFLGDSIGWVANPPGIISPVYPGIQFTYLSNGDSNGLFYYLGSVGNTQPWVNPTSIGALMITASNTASGSNVTVLADRQASDWYSSNESNAWVEFRLAKGAFICSQYLLRNRSENTHILRNWKFQASNDGVSWVDLSVHVNDTTLNSINQYALFEITDSTFSRDSYKRFRIYQNGLNSNNAYYLCLGELELYGLYIEE